MTESSCFCLHTLNNSLESCVIVIDTVVVGFQTLRCRLLQTSRSSRPT